MEFKMRKYLFYSLILFFSPVANADYWVDAVLGVCDKSKDEFKIEYLGAYNQEGDALHERVKAETVTECSLSDGVYKSNVRTFMRNNTGAGRCGAVPLIEVTIIKNSKEIYSSLIQNDCHYSKTFIRSLLISPQNKQLMVERAIGDPTEFTYNK